MPILENIKEHIVNPVILLLFGLALVYFLYGFLEYLRKGEDHKQAIENMKWGAVGMFIMVSVFGIMAIITNTIQSLMGS